VALQQPQPKSDFSNNSDVQIAITALEKYINDAATLAFPMIEWDAIVTYDQDSKENIVAVLREKSGIFYNLMLTKDDPSPLLQRFTEED
jgi:hypothetical protein